MKDGALGATQVSAEIDSGKFKRQEALVVWKSASADYAWPWISLKGRRGDEDSVGRKVSLVRLLEKEDEIMKRTKEKSQRGLGRAVMLLEAIRVITVRPEPRFIPCKTELGCA